jgi:hypothetical protein
MAKPRARGDGFGIIGSTVSRSAQTGMPTRSRLLRQLAQEAWASDAAVVARRLNAIDRLAGETFGTPADLRAFHELLCLWRAYPSSTAVLDACERVLRQFPDRRDVARHRTALENSGIAGTDIVYQFAAPTARWLAATFGSRLTIAWDRIEDRSRIAGHLLLAARPAEVPGLDEPPIPDPEAWLDRLRGGETDAVFLIGNLARIDAGELVRDRLFDDLNVTFRLAADGRPSRTAARWARAPVTLASRLATRPHRPDLRTESRRRPAAIREVSATEAREIIALAHESMVTRERDLDAFASADTRDVRIVDWERGLQFACLGVQPSRRFLLEAVYAFLVLQNGVPVGYALASALFGSSEIAFNLFETFRGGHTSWIYARLVATTRVLFRSDTFVVYPFQLGHENEEGLQSGAWWFYYKLGFRPREPRLARIIEGELARLARDPSYRTPLRTLRQLVRHHLFFSLGRVRDDAIGVLPMERIGLAVTAFLNEHFGTDRRAAEEAYSERATAILGTGLRRVRGDEALAWRRWAPLICALDGVERWPSADRMALAQAIRAKGGAREADAAARLTAHRRFRRSLRELIARQAAGTKPAAD